MQREREILIVFPLCSNLYQSRIVFSSREKKKKSLDVGERECWGKMPFKMVSAASKGENLTFNFTYIESDFRRAVVWAAGRG